MTMERTRPAALLVVVSLGSIVSCGGSEPPLATPTAEAPKVAQRQKPKQRLSMSGQPGSLDEGKVEETFNKLLPRFGDCLVRASSRVEFIGGHVKFFVRIALDGSAK